ncbi:LysR family transcriptional regulator [Lampropedia puyangensis]|uniref:LysR family transcriptional regulator n=1 Tax=Lampropedia puyangensis TaxID=1330072 RepID=A0A4V4GSE0_9BURK|nr:LysR family transcriptional regulator [Lampropedia puyangensis]THU05266.1 LysR family transcriptional regulator [Lampropedia puyangensis]
MASFEHLDLNLLRVFDVVMQERSLTKAAERLHVTQPAVSNAIRRLKEALHDELFFRSGHGIEPTARAIELWATVHQALVDLGDAIEPESFNPAHSEHVFHLGMIDATAARLLPPLAQIQMREAPDIQVHVTALLSRDPRVLLDEGEIDVAVGYFPAVQADLTARAQSDATVQYESRLLYQREYVCAMRNEHPLAHDEISLEDFCAARHLVVSLSGRPYGFIDEALSGLGLTRKVAMTVNQYYTAARIVAKTDLLTALPRKFVTTAEMAQALEIRELPLPVTPVSVHVLWLRGNRHPAAIAWLLDALQRSVQASL